MLDLTKPVQTLGGLSARIICQDRIGDERPLVVLVKATNGYENMYCYTAIGQFHNGHHPFNLINVPEKHKMTIWINVYSEKDVAAHSSKTFADLSTTPQRIACVPVEIEYEV